MKKCFLVFSLVIILYKSYAQIDGNLLVGLTNISDTEISTIQNPPIGAIFYNTSQQAIFSYSGSDWFEISTPGTAWRKDGNDNVNPTRDFLGTTNDIKMEIRSNNLPMLQFGRRQTLGLTQNYPDYANNDQPLVHVNGDTNTAALQFAASGASFYKPIFFTTANGSFRLKGSAGGTDLFELGSGGPANDGRLEFIIGDDGAEPIIFKRYDYRLGQFHTELFRVQGSDNTQNAKPRFGININPQQVPVDSGYDDSSASFNMANSTFQVNGSVSKSILVTSGPLTLDESHHTIIISANNHAITLPVANTCTGRIYVVKNPLPNTGNNSNDVAISSFIDHRGNPRTTVRRERVYWLQSDGTNWHLISRI